MPKNDPPNRFAIIGEEMNEVEAPKPAPRKKEPRSAIKERATAQGKVLGRSFCVTGVLSRPREEILAEIARAGGIVHLSVKQSTQYLVTGSGVGATKINKAKAYGTEVISEAELNRMLP